MSAPAKKSSAPTRHVYDVIVIGGQLGGIMASALFAKRGLHVLHAPHDGLGAPYRHQDLSLPHAPFFLPPIKALPAYDEVLQELGLGTTVGRATHLSQIQILSADRWYELSHDEKRRGPELARVFGAEAEAYDELLRKAQAAGDPSDAFFQSHPDLPPEGLWGRWKFRRQLPRFPLLLTDTPLEAADPTRRLLPFIAPVETPAALTRARTLGRTLAGPALYQGGREGLWRTFADRARELGADVLEADEEVERLSFEGSGVGLRLARAETTYRAPFVVAALDLDVLTRLVPEKQRRAASKQPSLNGQKALLTLNLVLPESALPRGLGTLALLEAPSLDGGALLLQVGPGPQADQRVLTVATPAPLGLRAGGEPAIRAMIAQVHTALARIMPFTRSHVTVESTPWLDAAPVVAGRAEVAPLFALPEDAPLGVGGVASHSPWKHVVLASRQVLPGLGFEGEVMAAQRAVRLVEKSLQKNDPLKARRPA